MAFARSGIFGARHESARQPFAFDCGKDENDYFNESDDDKNPTNSENEKPFRVAFKEKKVPRAINSLKDNALLRYPREGKRNNQDEKTTFAKERGKSPFSGNNKKDKPYSRRRESDWDPVFLRRDDNYQGRRGSTRQSGASHHDDRMSNGMRWNNRQNVDHPFSRSRNLRSSKEWKDGPSAGILSRRSRSRSWDNSRFNRRRASPSMDSDEEYRRSRSREKARRRKQYDVIQKYCRSKGDYQVFWDGFQWVKKNEAEGELCYDQQMNATRRARRLHIGNLPLFMDVGEDDLKKVIWNLLKKKNACVDPDICPVLHVWFAKDKGGNYGFIEMSTVDEAHEAIKLDGFLWNGVPVKISRPTDWRRSVDDDAIGAIAGASGLAVAESLAAAAQQAAATGNSAGLVTLVSKLPEEQQKAITDLISKKIPQEIKPVGVPMDTVKNQVRGELLSGKETHVLRVICPVVETEGYEDYADVLDDIVEECSKFGGIKRALMVKKDNEHKLPCDAELGDIFLQFTSCQQVDACILNLTGRIFDGRPIRMERFDEIAWKEEFVKYSEDIMMKRFKKGLANLE